MAIGGCGVGAGESAEGDATLTVTRDFGAELLLAASLSDPSSSETVARFLDREAEIETSFGGNFVDSIEGVSGGSEDGRRSDWFFYVNGYWSGVGAAESRVRPGDRIWWDYRDWEAAYRVPAVVGSWPEPFASGRDGERFPTAVICATDSAPCGEVTQRLEQAGAQLAGTPRLLADEGLLDRPAPDHGGVDPGVAAQLRVLVGPWEKLRSHPAAKLITTGPDASGVYGAFERAGRLWELVGLDPRGRERARFGRGAGLVAAVRIGSEQPTWLVTGTDEAGVEAATALLGANTLRERYAVAIRGRVVGDGGGGAEGEGVTGGEGAVRGQGGSGGDGQLALPVIAPADR